MANATSTLVRTILEVLRDGEQSAPALRHSTRQRFSEQEIHSALELLELLGCVRGRDAEGVGRRYSITSAGFERLALRL